MLRYKMAGLRIDSLPRRGQLCSLPPPLKKSHARQMFQGLDLFRQRRLGQTKPLRGRMVASQLGQSDERPY